MVSHRVPDPCVSAFGADDAYGFGVQLGVLGRKRRPEFDDERDTVVVGELLRAQVAATPV